MLWIWESYKPPRERLPLPRPADSHRESQPAQKHPFPTQTNQYQVYMPTHLLVCHRILSLP